MPKRIGDDSKAAREKARVVAGLARLRRDLRIVDLSNKRIAAFLGLTPRRVQQYLKDARPTHDTPSISPVIDSVPESESETSLTTTLQADGGSGGCPPNLLR